MQLRLRDWASLYRQETPGFFLPRFPQLHWLRTKVSFGRMWVHTETCRIQKSTGCSSLAGYLLTQQQTWWLAPNLVNSATLSPLCPSAIVHLFSSFPRHILLFFFSEETIMSYMQKFILYILSYSGWLKHKIIISRMSLWRQGVQDQSTSIIGFLMRDHR